MISRHAPSHVSKFDKGLPDNAGLGTPLRPRHCERSEAIHSATQKEWIASSLRSSQ
jgi:hypothetical protein